MRSHTSSLRSRGSAFPRHPADGGLRRGVEGPSSFPVPIFPSRILCQGGEESEAGRKETLRARQQLVLGRGRRGAPGEAAGSGGSLCQCLRGGRAPGELGSISELGLTLQERGRDTERGRNCRLSAIHPSPDFKGWGKKEAEDLS